MSPRPPAQASERTRRWSWLPQSLASRMFLLYGVTLLVASVLVLGVLAYQQFNQHIESNTRVVESLADVSAQPITESAVIGDFDTIGRLIGALVPSSPLREAVYIDTAGGKISATSAAPPRAPRWVAQLVAQQMPDVRRRIAVGGRDYGIIYLRFDVEQVAGELWDLVMRTAMVVFIGLGLGLVAARRALRRWLGNLDRLQAYEAQVLSGQEDAESVFEDDAPLEIRQALEVINRTAGGLRAQFGQRIDTLMNALIQHKKAMDEAAIVCELDLQGRLIDVNERFIASVGRDRERLLGRRLHEIGAVGTGDAPHWSPSPDIWHGEVAVLDGRGLQQWHSRAIVPIFDAEGAIEKFICIDIDISNQKASEGALLTQVRRQNMLTTFGQQALGSEDLQALQHMAVEMVCLGLHASHAALLVQEVDVPEGRVEAGVGWHPGWVGRPAAQLPGPGGALALSDEMQAAHGIRSMLAMPADPIGPRRFAIVAASDEARAFSEADSDFLRSLAHVLTAAVERHQAREHLTYLAQFDSLTGLPNRSLLIERLDHALAAARTQGTRVALMYLDLDRFKLVNDTLGHEAGDLLLVQAASRMVGCLRASDTVARLSGDEFAVLLTGLHDVSDAERVGRKLLEQLCKPFVLLGREASISASVGAAIYPDDGLESGELVRRADRAMYSSKNAGRNEFHFYDEAMSERVADRLGLQTELRAALEREEFFLVYQPKVELGGGRICGFEALLRWQHPQRGVVSPVEFIPVLEDTGMILGVGEWVIRQVARQVVAWQAQDLSVPRVAINLSARQFSSNELEGQLRAVLDDTGIDPSLLELELTESMLMQDPDAAATQLERIRGFGVRLSVDDFGTGYSSLSYLSRFALDALKVDRAFVRDLATSPDDLAIAQAIIGLAHSLKLKVVAEGVETTEQLDLLAQRGCDEIQGYYFSRPVSVDEAARMLGEGWGLHRTGPGGAWRRVEPHTPVGA